MARPSEFAEETALAICSRLATGEPLVRICKDAELPDVSTVYRWLAAHESFRDLYARAREDQADTLADEIVEIADDRSGDYEVIPITAGVASVVVDNEAINRSKLRVDARKWVAAKLKPKKYGDKVELAGPGDKGQHTVVTRIEEAIVDPKA